MLPHIVKVEVYVPEVIQVVSKVLILTKKEPCRMCIWWGMRARTFKIWLNKWCYLTRCHESECWGLSWNI